MSKTYAITRVHPDALELAELLRPSWPAISAGLRVRPTLVCEGEDDDASQPDDGGLDADANADGAGSQEERASGADGDDEEFDKDRAKAKIAKANREAAGLRKRLKELEPLAERAKELEDANKSESERRDEHLSSTTKERDSLKGETARLRVALRLGLTETQAKRLVGDTEEDLERDAEELLASFAPNGDDGRGDDEGNTRRRPRENLKPGTVPSAEADEEMDPRKLAKGLPSYA